MKFLLCGMNPRSAERFRGARNEVSAARNESAERGIELQHAGNRFKSLFCMGLCGLGQKWRG